MAVLNLEEEASLKELVSEYEAGRSVEGFIKHRLYTELSHESLSSPSSSGGVTVCGAPMREYEPGFQRQESTYHSLADEGMIAADMPESGDYEYHDLTSAGRNYFKEKERIEREKAEAREEERAYSRRQALKAFLAGAVLTAVVNYDKVAGLIGSLLSLLGR